MKIFQHLAWIAAALILGSAVSHAQQLMLPNVDFATYEQEAIEAVKQLPRKGGFKKNENYYHLYFFAASKREGVEWDNIKTQADFIRALDFQTPVKFEGYSEPTNIFADYIYTDKGKVRWVYANGEASVVDPKKQSGNSPQNKFMQVAMYQYQIVFVVEGLPQDVFFGIKDGVVYVTDHVIWEAYDTQTFAECLEMGTFRRIVNGQSGAAMLSTKEDDLVEGLATPPTFQGGDINRFRSWFSSEISKLLQLGIDISSTKTVLSFVVGLDGSVEQVTIESTDNIEMAKMGVQVLQNAPRWTPGLRSNGEPVKVSYKLPFNIDVKNASTVGAS